MKHKTHFAKRCIDRGITTVAGDKLGIEIHDHVTGRSKSIRVDRVGEYSGSLFYRFIVREGVFFAPVSETGWPYTVYTREMFRKRRMSKKHKKLARSHKDYRGART